MPYHDERAGLDAIRAIADRGLVAHFRDQMVDRHAGEPLRLPAFSPTPSGERRAYILAIDGSNAYHPIPGALPCTEAGFVSLGMVVIDMGKLISLEHLPDSGAANPRDLRATENPACLGMLLPGRNAARSDRTDPRTWFRQMLNEELAKASFGGETLAETLDSLLEEDRRIRCPNAECPERHVVVPRISEEGKCTKCQDIVFLSDGLRIHEQFVENESAQECHHRVRDTLELLALANALRYLSKSVAGRAALAKTAFVMDGPLAAFGTIAVLAQACRRLIGEVQAAMNKDGLGNRLLVMSGIKSGPFVEHAAELDRAPKPDTQIPNDHVWLPNNQYIRKHIIAGRLDGNSKPWGQLTYFGRPVVFKAATGQRLVLNLAQPEAEPPLTDATEPRVLGDALATAEPLAVGSHQFLALRRAHGRAAIPLRQGTDLIQALAP